MTKFLLAGFLIGSVGLVAAPITTYRFIGTVSSVGTNLGSTVAVGNAYQADFTYDEAVAPQLSTPNFSIYRSTFTEIRIATSGGPLTWNFSTPLSNNSNHSFTVDNNNLGRDAINFGPGAGLLSGPTLNSKFSSSVTFTLSDPSQTAFANANRPSSLNPSSFATKVLSMTFDGNIPIDDQILFSLVSIEKNPSAAIPEPASISLLAGALILGAVATRRSRR